MNNENKQQIKRYQTSKGHEFSTKEWLTLHFKAAEPEYKALIKSVGIQPGWRVLDAGCGSGEYIYSLSKLVGPKGHIYAIDLAPENIFDVKNNVQSNSIRCPVTAQIGNIFALPFPDNIFDAIWCSAVFQYFTDIELKKALKEFMRVVRQGGIVAVKDFDGTLFYTYPMDPTLLWRSAEAMDDFGKRRFFQRPILMKNILASNGFIDVVQTTTLIERRYPLREIEQEYISAVFEVQDVSWEQITLLSEQDQEIWLSISAKDELSYILNQSNFFWREGHFVAVGKVP